MNETFAAKIIAPGLIDPHLHFWLFALVTNAHFITPADWELPWDNAKGENHGSHTFGKQLTPTVTFTSRGEDLVSPRFRIAVIFGALPPLSFFG